MSVLGIVNLSYPFTVKYTHAFRIATYPSVSMKTVDVMCLLWVNRNRIVEANTEKCKKIITNPIFY